MEPCVHACHGRGRASCPRSVHRPPRQPHQRLPEVLFSLSNSLSQPVRITRGLSTLGVLDTPVEVVYLHPADTYHRLTRRLSQEHKGLEERALTWRPSGPLPPGDALDAGHTDARRHLRLPFLAASHPTTSRAHPSAGCGHGGTRNRSTSRSD